MIVEPKELIFLQGPFKLWTSCFSLLGLISLSHVLLLLNSPFLAWQHVTPPLGCPSPDPDRPKAQIPVCCSNTTQPVEDNGLHLVNSKISCCWCHKKSCSLAQCSQLLLLVRKPDCVAAVWEIIHNVCCCPLFTPRQNQEPFFCDDSFALTVETVFHKITAEA